MTIMSLAELQSEDQWYFDGNSGKIVVLFDPTPHQIELSGLGGVQQAFWVGDNADSGNNTTIRNLIVEKMKMSWDMRMCSNERSR